MIENEVPMVPGMTDRVSGPLSHEQETRSKQSPSVANESALKKSGRPRWSRV